MQDLDAEGKGEGDKVIDTLPPAPGAFPAPSFQCRKVW